MRLRGRLRRVVFRAATVLGLAALFYAALLLVPAPLFPYAYAGTIIVLHSEAPLPSQAGDVLRRTEGLVTRSPLFAASPAHDIYVCDGSWRWWLLSGGDKRAAALALAPAGRAVIVRKAHMARNRAVQASGTESPYERTLDYFFAHEVTHTMTADFLGPMRYLKLPIWVREGYADYVARGSAFDYDDARAAFLGGERTISPPQGGRYLGYTLLVAHLLDREGWTVEALLRAPPNKAEVEERVRSSQVKRRP